VFDTTALGEQMALPADTESTRKYYTSRSGPAMFVTVVFSGNEQRSLHRPQQCLPAQGLVIESQRVTSVPLGTNDALPVMLLRVRSPAPSGAASHRPADSRQLFAYWYSSAVEHTPYVLQRLASMARDRVVRGKNYRWAYVTVQTGVAPGSDRHLDAIKSFIAALYPLIRQPPVDRDQ
jgi:EpsI family protein